MWGKVNDFRVWLVLVTVGIIVLSYRNLTPAEIEHITSKDSIVFWFGFPFMILFFIVLPLLSWIADLYKAGRRKRVR